MSTEVDLLARMVAFQAVPFPTNDTNPWVWIAGACAIGIGVIFWKYDSARQETVTRCYTREDKLMDENKVCLASTRDLLAAVTRSVEIAEGAVALHRHTDVKIEANRQSVEDVKRISTDILRAIDEMRRSP